MIDEIQIKTLITEAGLKITPQRLMVLRAVHEMENHPSADQVLEFIRRNHPYLGSGTVYSILEVFAERGIVKRVKTEKGILRYDPVKEKHHHIYCTENESIEDYYDNELNTLLENHFNSRGIKGFEIEELSLHIIGKYNTNQKK
jgi:Fur family peroxide stress response transcriptional regulator